MAATGSPESPFASFVWKNRAPPREKFFAWLLVQERVQCRAVLVRKHIMTDAECALCHHPLEDCTHIIFECPFSAQVWSALSIDTAGSHVSTLWTMRPPASLPTKHFSTLLLLLCWQLWKHRNSVVFDHMEPSLRRFWNTCRQEATLWSCRLPQDDWTIADDWCTHFPSI
ncbi:unnamed protein product [Urochloa humidicola]